MNGHVAKVEEQWLKDQGEGAKAEGISLAKLIVVWHTELVWGTAVYNKIVKLK